jgi:hypothetical protein
MEKKKSKYPKPSDGIELIQQWQYMGHTHPKLCEDQAFENCKRYGITSVQSYVSWAEIETEKSHFDFSMYDGLVEKLKKHGLKWVPFLILGPNFATPKWFQMSSHSVYAKCLEHDKECKIQSIWNPHLPAYVERFLEQFSNHYADPSVFESIALGISGNWGEAIYPATGGFLGGFHVHPGWWCGDDYAREDFKNWALEKYGPLDKLNTSWGTDFIDFGCISFPQVSSLWKDIYFRAVKSMPASIKPYLKKLKTRWSNTVATLLNQVQVLLNNRALTPIPKDLQRRIDFIQWYQSAMTRWAEFWLKTARYSFPDSKIYLVTGGSGEPILGAELSAQAKVAAKYKAGVRVTNQTDDYGVSFVHARLVSSASRNYGAYFTTEEAGINRAHGVTMRIFDAVSSGAAGAYFKSVIGTGKDPCIHKSLPAGQPTAGAKNLFNNLKYFHLAKPIIEIAVLYPNTAISVNPTTIDALHNQCSQLRRSFDLDLIDEHMIADGKLDNYKFLIILSGKWIKAITLSKIKNWIATGGIFISTHYLALTPVCGTSDSALGLGDDEEELTQIQDGFKIMFSGNKGDYLRFLSILIRNKDGIYPWKSPIDGASAENGHYFSKFPNDILYYDPIRHTIQAQKRKDLVPGQ